jgi:predicted RNA-binding Zn-ribbon protein involved in translation (DUF1610 family)
MSDLVRREDIPYVDLNSDMPHSNVRVFVAFKESIDSMPSAEAVQGEWTKRVTVGSVDFAYCSECKQPIIHGHTSPLWNFCPNCGARMKGADDEREDIQSTDE